MSRVLVYLLRRDLRLADNPIFCEIARLGRQSKTPFTHVLPVYVFAAEQIEISGFLASDQQRSPYPEARSQVGSFWRCGKLRAKFVAESIWDLKKELETIGSGLELRVGSVRDVVKSILDGYRGRENYEVHGVWMTREDAWEEQREEKQVQELVEDEDKEFKLWHDEKYFVDDRDLPFPNIDNLSDVFTTFRKTVEPLRTAPRQQLPKPDKIPPLPDFIPHQASPFQMPASFDEVVKALWKPVTDKEDFSNMPSMPQGAKSAHPFEGGSMAAQARVRHLLDSGAISAYKETRNGLLGLDFSTKMSAWLALGCMSARQIHWMLIDFEDGKGEIGKHARGYGQGENNGTAAVRFELLWRDYMRLCTKKFGQRLFYLGGYKQDREADTRFIRSPFTSSTAQKNKGGSNDDDTRRVIERFVRGQTGIGLIDASMRELSATGWTSNRARQNVASFLSKHLGIDWRLGAEWYESNLIDYDVSSNWGNWQYVAGVGNDPRGDARVFNPVKQAYDYDTHGDYVRTWVPELRDVGRLDEDAEAGKGNQDDLMGVFQAWRLPASEKEKHNLLGIEWVEKPLVRVEFSVNRRDRGGNRGGRGKGGRGRDRGRGRGNQGRDARSGVMEKTGWNT